MDSTSDTHHRGDSDIGCNCVIVTCGADQISGNVPIVMQQVFDTMSEATGVDFAEILKAQTYDAKVNKNVNVTGLDRVTGQPLPEG